MKYYSSMTLADYVAANWLEMDPDLVRLIEKEASLLNDAREDAEAWQDNYEDVLRNAEEFKADVLSLLDEYSFTKLSFEDLIISLRSLARDVEFEL